MAETKCSKEYHEKMFPGYHASLSETDRNLRSGLITLPLMKLSMKTDSSLRIRQDHGDSCGADRMSGHR